MIRITNGQEVLTVTQSAYHEIFKRSGYKPYHDMQNGEGTSGTMHGDTKAHDKPTKPISQWSKRELTQYIVRHGGKADGHTDELRATVREHMRENG